jgi:formate hydrogenlyase subunit 4
MIFQELLGAFLQVALYVGIAPGVIGVLRWLQARLQGRRGPRPDQIYRDLWKLFHKKPVVPDTASWIFSAAPLVVFSCYVLLGLLIPIVYLAPETISSEITIGVLFGRPWADLLVLIYLLGLARFALGLAGMDAGAPFGDLGSSREMFLHFLAEPTMIFVVFALALKAHTTSLPAILQHFMKLIDESGLSEIYYDPALWLIGLALSLVTLAEAGRLPFDNPGAHLELTMIGKAIHLEYAGLHLALLEWAEAMRLTFFLTLMLNLFFPYLLGSPEQSLLRNALLILAYPFKLCLLLIILAVWEMTRAKIRLRAVAGPATLALVFSMLAVVIVVLREFTF